MGSNEDSVSYLYDQVYEDIRDECLANSSLFRDPSFPPEPASFYSNYDAMKPRPRLKWLRPGEISDSPKFISDGVSRFDTVQGTVGNCWFVSALTNFAALQEKNHSVFAQVVPDGQSFEENYAGVFRFRFWQYGQWVEVVVDDRLPTSAGVLASLKSSDDSEFWAPLLEKAYAKLSGSYGALTGGLGSEAYVDFTGTISELYRQPFPDDFYSRLSAAHENHSFIGCIYEDEEVGSIHSELGLVNHHYYAVTAVREVDFEFLGEGGSARMLRLRNPWGNSVEWKGPGHDQSVEWDHIPDESKEALDLKVEHDGEFWMPYKSFKDMFYRVEICQTSPHEYSDDWSSREVHGIWHPYYDGGDIEESEGSEDSDHSEGAAVEHESGEDKKIKKILWTRPQHFVTVAEDDTTLIIHLTEKHSRQNDRTQTIQVFVYRRPRRGRLTKRSLEKKVFLYMQTNYGRDVSCRVTLDAGRYVVIPAGADAEVETEYYMRIIHDKHIDVHFAT